MARRSSALSTAEVLRRIFEEEDEVSEDNDSSDSEVLPGCDEPSDADDHLSEERSSSSECASEAEDAPQVATTLPSAPARSRARGRVRGRGRGFDSRRMFSLSRLGDAVPPDSTYRVSPPNMG